MTVQCCDSELTMSDPLDNVIEPGVMYCERESGTWTVVEDIYISEDGETQVRIWDRLFPSPGRKRSDCMVTPETEHRTVTKWDMIERIGEGELVFMDKNGGGLDVET